MKSGAFFANKKKPLGPFRRVVRSRLTDGLQKGESMSIAGVGSHTGYYYGLSMQKQVEKGEAFAKCLSSDGADVALSQGCPPRLDTQKLYEAMAGSGHTDINSAPVLEDNTGAVTIAECEEEGEFLGLTMVPEEGQTVTYGMRAMLPESSTPANPVVQVVSNLGGEKVIYNVEINKVDPDNATQLEMFALLSYTDEKGMSDGGTFGSFQQLKVYSQNASLKGYCGDLSGGDIFINDTFEWSSILDQMMKDYFNAEIYKQSEDCRKLIDVLGKLSKAFEETEINTEKAVTCTYETTNPEDNDVRYTTTYTEDGMECRRDGSEQPEWSIRFDNPEQHEKVEEFINMFPEDWNLVFASRESFWTDLINDKVDVDSYQKYINGESMQIPEGMVIEREVVSLPSTGISFYFNEGAREVACVDDRNQMSGRQNKWSRRLSEDEMEKCKELFAKFKGKNTWEYEYEAYLADESYWEQFLSGELDLADLLKSSDESK